MFMNRSIAKEKRISPGFESGDCDVFAVVALPIRPPVLGDEPGQHDPEFRP